MLTSGSSPLDADGRQYFLGDDTWTFDGHRWSLVSRSDRPMSGVRLAWDSRRGRMLSFGGYLGRSGSIGDLRVLEDGRWRVLDARPDLATAEAGFVYDDRRDRLVLFGGGGGAPGSARGEVWQHDGTSWSRWEGAAPPGRQAHAMVHDSRRGVTIVYGGSGSGQPGSPPPRLDDLWEFDGTRWREVEFAGGPGPRMAAGATFDAKRGVMLLFGGMDATGMRGDLWSWDGATWTQLATEGPAPRAMGALAYDAARDRVVLFGGRRGWPDDLNDTWEWDGRAWTEVRP
jgi:hypothetical protein